MDSLTAIVGFELSFLFVALLLLRVLRLDLSSFTVVYVILVSSKAIVSHLAYPELSFYPIVAVGFAGLLFITTFSGVFGASLGADNYGSILAGVGLFPWYFDMGMSIIYFILTLLFISVVTEIRVAQAFRSIGSRKMRLSIAKQKLSEEQFKLLTHKGSTVFAVPIMLAAFVASIAVSL